MNTSTESKAAAPTSDLALLTDAVYALRANFQAVAVDRGINFDKEAGFAMQILGASDFLMSAAMSNRQSVENAITNVAAIGISLNPAKKQAYLVPRKGVICLDISYMGLIDLAVDSGSILWAQAAVVRENDNFVINGFDKPPTHGHDPFAGIAARGPIKGAYVVVKTADGEYLTHTMDIDQIYSVRDRSESWKKGQSGPWKTDEIEMIKKTVVKQAYKYWPKTDRSGRVDEAIQLLNTEGGEGFPPITNGGRAIKDQVSAPDALAQAALAASSKGKQGFQLWYKTLNIQDRALISGLRPQCEVIWLKADAKAGVTDVKDKTAAKPDVPVVTYESVMARMTAAKSQDALDVAYEWSRELDDPAQKAELDDLANKLSSKFRRAA